MFYEDLNKLQLRFPGKELTKLGYSKGYVSDIINKKKEPSEDFLRDFYNKFSDGSPRIETAMDKTLPLGDLKVTLKDYVELLKEKARIVEDGKREAEQRERTLLALLENNLTEIKANSISIRDHLRQVGRMVRADDLEMMDSLDRLEGREVGTSSTEAGIVEHGLGALNEDIDTNAAKGKEGNSGKVKQKRS